MKDVTPKFSVGDRPPIRLPRGEKEFVRIDRRTGERVTVGAGLRVEVLRVLPAGQWYAGIPVYRVRAGDHEIEVDETMLGDRPTARPARPQIGLFTPPPDEGSDEQGD